ncbi:unnamed protein product [Litomosoides sigmodontis]|uniref:SPT2 homolog N-terminal domain-containing protein n=1 Tax=Litomosoides sigmodontis TaxID=42156 RepID=A0A3P6VEZ6_LITSI|nr:unnamed protein product [Litomosoides sigmodontis]
MHFYLKVPHRFSTLYPKKLGLVIIASGSKERKGGTVYVLSDQWSVMDVFDDILKQASSNTKNASKEIKRIDEARQKTKKCMNVRLAAERKQSKIAEPPPEKPKSCNFTTGECFAGGGNCVVLLDQVSASYFQAFKFVIPKEKTKDNATVDRSKIALFLKRKEEERQKALTQQKKQKEKLIKLRLQNYGGKANKRLAKQFGSTPIELQKKYGNDCKHEEHLKKQQIKEKLSFYVLLYYDVDKTEESDRLNSELRGSIAKAVERKKIVEKAASIASYRNGPYRVATNKKNGLRHLTKEDSPGPSTSCALEGKSRKIGTKIAIKRRLPPSESSFLSLMKKAEAIQNGKTSPSPPPLAAAFGAKKQTRNELREFKKMKFHTNKPKSASEDSEKAATIKRSSNAAKRMDDIKTGCTKEQKASQSVSSGSTFVTPSRRYLPGDIRYQGPSPEQSQLSVKTNGNPSNAAKTSAKEFNNDMQARKPKRTSEKNVARASDRRHDPSVQIVSQNKAVARFKAHKHLHLKERRHLEQLHRLRDDEFDEDVDDEEEYDSEMDDFIDDSEFDEHLKRGDLEETLRLINPRYDKNRWKLRERMIDDRLMEASYRDIAREEKRSSRIGLIEDIREAHCGKSVAL